MTGLVLGCDGCLKEPIVYTNDLVSTDSSGNPLPQIELAQQN